jgi:hypothetical protein
MTRPGEDDNPIVSLAISDDKDGSTDHQHDACNTAQCAQDRKQAPSKGYFVNDAMNGCTVPELLAVEEDFPGILAHWVNHVMWVDIVIATDGTAALCFRSLSIKFKVSTAKIVVPIIFRPQVLRRPLSWASHSSCVAEMNVTHSMQPWNWCFEKGI